MNQTTDCATQIDCPACAKPAKQALPISVCSKCQHRWMVFSYSEVTKIQGQVYTSQYQGYVRDHKLEAVLNEITASVIKPVVGETARILDIGCGAGTFLDVASRSGYSITGIDISEAAASLCRKRGLDAFSGDFLTHDFKEKFDVITLWDVFEHLQDPSAFLDRAHTLLKPGGMIIGKVPAFGKISVSLAKRSPRFAGLMLGAPDHIQYFYDTSFAALVDRTHFLPAKFPWTGKAMREKRKDGSFKKRTGRFLRDAVARISGDKNIYFKLLPKPETR